MGEHLPERVYRIGQHFLIASLPNSGSDWFASCVDACAPPLRYFEKEYFNPITNKRRFIELSRLFGCEMAGCYRRIALNSAQCEDQLDALFDSAWMQDGFNFTKEVWSPTKLAWFAKRFNVVVLTRQYQTMMPPSRNRVWTWYEAMYQSFVASGHIRSTCDSLAERCRIAHTIAMEAMLQTATRIGLPVIRYEVLAYGEPVEVEREIDCGWIASDAVDRGDLIERIIETRKPTKYPRAWRGLLRDAPVDEGCPDA